MKSPFPGMDPYLELTWRDIHHSLVVYASDQLQPKLPADLAARIEEQVYVRPVDKCARQHPTHPDVLGVEQLAQAVDATLEEPLVLIDDEPLTEGFIEIREAGAEHRLITAIEFLSPSNKATKKGRRLYRAKQKELRRARVSLVEIDLLRGGNWVLNIPQRRIPITYRTLFHVCVRRGWRPEQAEIYRLPLRAPLPAIKIPLRKTDQDVRLDLQSLIDQCYVNGRYDSIDYSVALEPPFEAADAAWVNELLKAAARR